jgi:opacity protein-like surface antigen
MLCRCRGLPLIVALEKLRLREAPMLTRIALALVPVCCLAAAARADGLMASNLPTLAVDPPPISPRAFDLPAASPWGGFYVGSEMTAASRKGAKGLFGGSALAGSNYEFSNKIVLGVEASAGFNPNMLARGTAGNDFAAMKFKLGYDMGRLMPFVTAGISLAKPTTGTNIGFSSASDSLNDLFSSSPNVKTFGSIGAGFDYALTNNLSVGIAVSANKGVGFPTWP